MATLKRLIQGQDVRFDTHQAGDSQPTNWHNLHLEKILHKDKGGGKIRFPLIGGYEPNWSKGVSQNQYDAVRKEVQHELRKNNSLIEELIETVVKTLHRFSSGMASKEDCKVAAEKLAGFFGLDEKFVGAVEEYAGNHLLSFISYHVNPENKMFQEIRLSAKKVEIKQSRRSRIYFQTKRYKYQ